MRLKPSPSSLSRPLRPTSHPFPSRASLLQTSHIRINIRHNSSISSSLSFPSSSSPSSSSLSPSDAPTPPSTPSSSPPSSPSPSSSPSSPSTPISLIETTILPAPHIGHIKILSLNSPKNRNAISRALLAELSAHISTIAAEDPVKDPESQTRALIIASSLDNAFCAGADLKERRGFTGEETTQFLSSLRSTLTSLSALPIPTISAIASVALGGGFELALATTFRILTQTATVGLPETRLGIIPGAGGTYRLPALIGQAKALEVMLTGRRINGTQAHNLGIAERLIPMMGSALNMKKKMVKISDAREEKKKAEEKKLQDSLMRLAREMVLKKAVEFANEIAGGGPVAIRSVLAAVREGGEEGENKAYERVVGTEDRDEALRAFAEKREVVFKGR